MMDTMKRDCHDGFGEAVALLARNQPLFFALGDMARQEIIILLTCCTSCSILSIAS